MRVQDNLYFAARNVFLLTITGYNFHTGNSNVSSEESLSRNRNWLDYNSRFRR